MRSKALALAGLCALAVALALPAGGAAATRQFKAIAVGQDTSESFGADGIHLASQVRGVGTELGSFTQILDYVISYDLVDFAGTGTITAADGSQLFLTFVGTEPGFAAQIFPTPFSGTLTITDGTGRFDAASGRGAIAGIDFGQGRFTFSLDGTLSR
jgi:hypothetical protein